MCQLLGMSANVPTDICFSFSGLIVRGGDTGPHRDGWGLAFYEQKGCRQFHDPSPSAESPLAKLLSQWSIKSDVVIGHIRQANVGVVSLENTQPYQRELWGRPWTFAHNGQIPEVLAWPAPHYQATGSTDSEQAFCWLLGSLRAAYPERPSLDVLRDFIQSSADQLAQLGVFNMLLSDGEYLFSYCASQLHWITRRAPFGEASLQDVDCVVDFGKETTPNDIVTVIATEALTDNEQWNVMSKGELTVFRDGLAL